MGQGRRAKNHATYMLPTNILLPGISRLVVLPIVAATTPGIVSSPRIVCVQMGFTAFEEDLGRTHSSASATSTGLLVARPSNDGRRLLEMTQPMDQIFPVQGPAVPVQNQSSSFPPPNTPILPHIDIQNSNRAGSGGAAEPPQPTVVTTQRRGEKARAGKRLMGPITAAVMLGFGACLGGCQAHMRYRKRKVPRSTNAVRHSTYVLQLF